MSGAADAPSGVAADATPDVLTAVLDGAARAVGFDPRLSAIVAGRRRLSHADLARRVQRLANSLLDRGFASGDVVLLSVRPGPDAVLLALAVAGLGGVLVVADPGAGPEVFEARISLLGKGLAAPSWAAAESPLYTLSGDSRWQAPLRVAARRRGLLLPGYAALPVRHLYAGAWLPGVPRGASSLRRLTRRPAGSGAEVDLLAGKASRAPLLVVFTSGTTGAPKAVVHSRASLGAALTVAGDAFPFAPGDRLVTDQLMIALTALAGGATWYVPRIGHHPDDLARHLVRHRATHAFTTPVGWASVLDLLSRNGSARDNGTDDSGDQVDVSLPESLRHVLTGGAPVPARLLTRLAAAAPSAAVLGVYGATELLPAAVVDAATKAAHQGEGDLVGTPLPGVTAAIGEEEVLLDGPHRFEGYLSADGVVAQRPVRTGDAGRLVPATAKTSEPGGAREQLVLVGRLKDMIIRGSMNIYPGLYEPALQSVPGVLECALVGAPDPDSGDERVVLVVVPEDLSSSDEVLAAVRRRLPQLMDAAALPDDVVLLPGPPGLPRSGRSAKLDRLALAELLRERLAVRPRRFEARPNETGPMRPDR